MGLGDFLKAIGEGAVHGVETGLNDFNEAIGLPRGDVGQQDPRSQGILSRPLEELQSGIRYAYNNYVSQPLSTLELMGRETSVDGGDWRKALSAGEWARSWRAAEHISPGQAATYGKHPFTGGPSDYASGEQLINSPLEYKAPDPSALPPNWNQIPHAQQQALLAQAGMPQVNKAVEDARNESKWFRYGSGLVDFEVSWYLDPLVVGGKAVGAAKRSATVIKNPTGGWSGADIDAIMGKSRLTALQQHLWANKDNPQLINNLPMVQRSALGPRFGSILSTLQSQREVADFLRVTMGDAAAMQRLRDSNARADLRISQNTSRLSQLGQARAAALASGNPHLASVVASVMDTTSSILNRDADMVSRYNDVLGSAHQLNELHTSAWSFARAAQRTEAQNAYRAGPALTKTPLSRRPLAAQPISTSPPLLYRTPAAGGLTAPRLSTPLDFGVGFSRMYTDFFALPTTIIRSFGGNFRPSGHMDINSINGDAINELRGYLARIPSLSAAERGEMVNKFLRSADESERRTLLQQYEQAGVNRVTARHGFSADEGQALYREHLTRQGAYVEQMRQYSSARMPDVDGVPIPVDQFHDQGGNLVVHPNLVTRLMNDHIFMDLDQLDKVLTRHGSAIRALRLPAGGIADWGGQAADWMNQMWKFSTLFRLGYIPRVLGDDLAGQVARLGAGAMAMRVGVGVRNAATNLMRWQLRPHYQAREFTAREGVRFTTERIAQIDPQIARLERHLAAQQTSNTRFLATAQRQLAAAQRNQAALSPSARPATIAAHASFVNARVNALRAAQANLHVTSPGRVIALATLRRQRAYLHDQRTVAERAAIQAHLLQQKVIQGSEPVLTDGMILPGAFQGVRGQFYQKSISADPSLENIFSTNKAMLNNYITRSFDHGAVPVSALRNEELHTTSWAHALNAQLAQDALGRLALAGHSVAEMTDWLTHTGAGRAYYKRLGVHFDSQEYAANSVWHDVAETAPTPGIRQAALSPEGVTGDLLRAEVPDVRLRPEVHTGQLGENLAHSNQTVQAMQHVFKLWFDTMTGLPANRWSRHPLFNQLYEGHAQRIVRQEIKQGVIHTADDAERVAETARRIALHDMRRLVFDIAHRTDAAAALRLVSPFFAATAEGWQRWARIAADRPEVVGYATKFFNAPLSWGVVQDADGNAVDDQGYSYDPVTKKRRLVPKTDRRIIMRLPKVLVEGHNPIGLALGASPAGTINLSQDSMNLVLSGDPIWNPGEGPIVQVPVQELVKDKPNLAHMAAEIGVLPFGVSTNDSLGHGVVGRTLEAALPRTLKNFLSAFNTSDSRYQQVKLQITQQAAFEHTQLGKPLPSAQEIADRVRNYWLFSAASAFLGPVASQQQDPYAYYRDQYNKLRRIDPLRADDTFLQQYGESYFLFAQALTKNKVGAEATMNAVRLSQKYAGLIAQNPELASLIIGPEGNGPFSPEAYAYQLNHPLVPGSAEMQRSRLTAEQALTENQRRLGWAKYAARMNTLNAQLFKRGLKTFNDSGAEDLLAQKRGYTQLYALPLYPDGTRNPYYNKAWAAEFNSQDPQKYAALIPGLTDVARSPLADLPSRSDLRVLQQYLGARQVLAQTLAARKAAGGAGVLTAKANADLSTGWARVVQDLIESDTRFGDLYHRYLSRDMGTDILTQMQQEGLS